LKVEWVELRNKEGFRRFKKILENLKIPHKDLKGNIESNLNKIFEEIFNDKNKKK